ncbi:hypothetical protein MsAg5_13000 [Methanosarcinaceae archaeon Ag5]|uniref:Uncharacterized protein n=1 Tax=Methanolapillus africanus TaxID=3028297 RepID=A0AAE4MKD5_9EURY|nr:hypothetical protein [Methanosarcinaceae archaeon Ag5]
MTLDYNTETKETHDIECDICGETDFVEEEDMRFTDVAEEYFATKGWASNDGENYCPNCRKENHIHENAKCKHCDYEWPASDTERTDFETFGTLRCPNCFEKARFVDEPEESGGDEE